MDASWKMLNQFCSGCKVMYHICGWLFRSEKIYMCSFADIVLQESLMIIKLFTKSGDCEKHHLKDHANIWP